MFEFCFNICKFLFVNIFILVSFTYIFGIILMPIVQIVKDFCNKKKE